MLKSRIRILSVVWVFAMILSGASDASEVLYRVTGSLRAGDGPDLQPHLFKVEEGVTLEVIARSEIDTTMEAVLPDGSTLFNDDYEGLNPGFTRTMPQSGELQLTVAPYHQGAEGEYEITITEIPVGAWVRANETVHGVLSDATGNRNRYRLAGQAGARVVIDLMSDEFDAFLELSDDAGNFWSDDDGGEGLNSRLTHVFEQDGTVMITTRSFSGSDEGAYTLQIRESSHQLYAEYEGHLRGDIQRGYDGKPLSHYVLEGAAGELISITVESDDFDTMLFLNYPDGSRLAMDDDGGSGTNSQLDVELPEDGAYSLYVTSFESDGQGAYLLRIYR